MNAIKLSLMTACLVLSVGAHANEVLITSDQSMKIGYKVAHKNINGSTVFGELQTVTVNPNFNIHFNLDQYDRAGVVIISVDGHILPASANQFDQAKQCSMTTDLTKATGALKFTLSPHSVTCSTYGGIYS